ncbi:MAG TPA: response regulator [Magnetospirillaceae bacterium]|nr:response regulator [Magnetospirillaceae bacterium]
MTKIMLVEDDKSLREIYGVRLLAEGYDIVSAGDGEEALAMAIKERPVLIVTDVMMPRISGFDMLDILRSTTETKNIKVIMMTALSSEDQRKHGEQLGADRYLVKSQVGIEDVVRVVHEVLGDGKTPPPPASIPTAATPTPAAPATPTPSAAQPAAPAQPATLPVPATPTLAPAAPIAKPTPQPANLATPKPSLGPTPSTSPGNVGTRQRVIQPISDPTSRVDINNLLDKELAREAGVDMNNLPTVATTQQERAVVDNQIRSVVPPSAPVAPQPAPVQPLTPPVAPQPAPTPVRPPIQAPPRPNVAPIQPRQGGVPPAPGV